MLRRLLIGLGLCFILLNGFAQKLKTIKHGQVKRWLTQLSSDKMMGRKPSSPQIEKAIEFIEQKFSKAGLQPLKNQDTYRQLFYSSVIKPQSLSIILDSTSLADQSTFAISRAKRVDLKDASDLTIVHIGAQQSFFDHFRKVINTTSSQTILVLVDNIHASFFAKVRERYVQSRGVMASPEKQHDIFFVLTDKRDFRNVEIHYKSDAEENPLINLIGILPGKSKADEFVIFSAHYDHLGILSSIAQDSIANGADDDASGCVAVMQLAQYFKKADFNERTLVFIAFSGEEIGGFGSKYFAQNWDVDKTVAMFNIEMIGKVSKFGSGAAFLTGFDKSNLGEIMQKNLKGSTYSLYPDPYLAQNLFYRSDNKSLAELGVPAHSISTDQIDQDKLYHSVNDEVESLDIQNMTEVIRAIALGATSIVEGKDTPSRINKK